MYAPHFRLRSFDILHAESREAVLRHLLEALIEANVAYLEARPETPWLYESGVTYEEERFDRDDWNDIPETLVVKVGDCEDLAAWRIAELRMRAHEDARPHVTFDQRGARVTYHVTVRRADGRIEDPSRVLGMGRAAGVLAGGRAGHV